ncbi:hypothetical protein HQQ94_03720 [Shewanella sp. VB17]|uniref:hypothetical protein n=1 Tax=Shewanella sp. VB17 TaxID=2739432 RepID=UPI001564815F|nr:hypothetical protein [Shewanella sp. VB17]NRD72364.1 hypothetical protein [Shewanella sp. VB17]
MNSFEIANLNHVLITRHSILNEHHYSHRHDDLKNNLGDIVDAFFKPSLSVTKITIGLHDENVPTILDNPNNNQPALFRKRLIFRCHVYTTSSYG